MPSTTAQLSHWPSSELWQSVKGEVVGTLNVTVPLGPMISGLWDATELAPAQPQRAHVLQPLGGPRHKRRGRGNSQLHAADYF